ncbi:DivIVA domain-containing protein [Microbacterium sp. No. 7]|uniref:DivIVA domain-containing protein n=1 Tax=Microbacterium sp. No. 7 TaxID=1714373 RepID=UPI000A6754D1|nr:DivIVA domain-containing protein [Microbacterium sp. No. 7]
MTDQQSSTRDEHSPFDSLFEGPGAEQSVPTAFTTAFRGYEKAEVDAALSELASKSQAREQEFARQLQQLRSNLDSAGADAARRVAELESQLSVMSAKATTAEQQVQTLTEELMGATGESAERGRFEEVLHVAEEQASAIIRNASAQAERLLAAAHEEIESRRKDAQADAQAIASRAEQEAQQARLRIETELQAHTAQLEREAAHAAEKVTQAEQEAVAIRTEAEKGAAALRSLVSRETEQARADAETAVREMRVRVLEFEESLTRRQDDAQQEFLMLHNQAVAHAERITKDANDQVAASLEHSQRITAKADDFDRLMRAQAQQIEADAKLRAREVLDRAQVKSRKIIDTVTGHAEAVLRDAEDRTRQLRWQQHQLTSFMAEVRELMRPEGVTDGGDAAPVAAPAEAPQPEAEYEVIDAEVDEQH